MVRLFAWERGMAVQADDQEQVIAYLWFYEWNLFEAFRAGEHTLGRRDSTKSMGPEGVARQATVTLPGLELALRAEEDGASLRLTATNETDHAWPEIAAIIPCLAPGDFGGPDRPVTTRFLDTEHTHTYYLGESYLGESGLELLEQREIHFCTDLRPAIDLASHDGQFVFSDKWPTSPRNARAGLLLRESGDGEWVMGIAWERFLSAQGHNPWNCMHLSVRLGPLQPGESRSVRGKLYLLRGSKADGLRRFQQDFAVGE